MSDETKQNTISCFSVSILNHPLLTLFRHLNITSASMYYNFVTVFDNGITVMDRLSVGDSLNASIVCALQ